MVFLAALLVASIIQLIAGAEVIANPEDADSVQTIAILVIVCFLIGIASAWELVGGPSVGLRHEIGAFARSAGHHSSDAPASEPTRGRAGR
jgi:hypothetical protein